MKNSINSGSPIFFPSMEPVNNNVNQSRATSNQPEDGPSTQIKEKPAEPTKFRRTVQQLAARFPQVAAWQYLHTAQQYMHDLLPFQPPKTVRLGTVNVIPMPGTDHLVPKQKDDGVEDSSLWRKGLNYSSTLYVSEVTHAGIDKLGLPNNQSDIYAHMFGDDANNISKGIRDIREYLQAAHNKLHDTLDNHSAQHYLDKRHEQLEEVAPKARNIRDKLEKVWTWGNRVKRVVSKTAGAFMFVQDVKSVAFNFGSRPKSARIKKPLQDTYTYKFKTMAFESAPHAVLTALVTETAIKKAFDSYPPEYFSGLGDSRRDMARMAEVFLEASKMAKDIRAEDDVAAALTREYGAGGHEFLEILMSEVDRCAYNYMQALKSKPSRFMNADDFLAESGATSASLQLMYARLEEARFIDTFWKNNQPVVKTLEGDPKSPGTCVLLEAKNPSKEDVQPSSRA